MQFCTLFHRLHSNVRSDLYSLSYCEKRPFFGFLSWQLAEYWSDCKFKNRRWNRMQNCIIYIDIILGYNQDSTTELEPEFWVRKNEALLYVHPSQITAGFRCSLGFKLLDIRQFGSLAVLEPYQGHGSGFNPELLLTLCVTQCNSCCSRCWNNLSTSWSLIIGTWWISWSTWSFARCCSAPDHAFAPGGAVFM